MSKYFAVKVDGDPKRLPERKHILAGNAGGMYEFSSKEGLLVENEEDIKVCEKTAKLFQCKDKGDLTPFRAVDVVASKPNINIDGPHASYSGNSANKEGGAYACKICNQQFPTLEALSRHCHMYHGISDPSELKRVSFGQFQSLTSNIVIGEAAKAQIIPGDVPKIETPPQFRVKNLPNIVIGKEAEAQIIKGGNEPLPPTPPPKQEPVKEIAQEIPEIEQVDNKIKDETKPDDNKVDGIVDSSFLEDDQKSKQEELPVKEEPKPDYIPAQEEAKSSKPARAKAAKGKKR